MQNHEEVIREKLRITRIFSRNGKHRLENTDDGEPVSPTPIPG